MKGSQTTNLKMNESSYQSSEDHKEIDIDDLLSGIDFTDYKTEMDQSDCSSTPGRVSVRVGCTRALFIFIFIWH